MDNTLIAIIVVVVGIIIVAGLLVFVGLRNPQVSDDQKLAERLGDLLQRGEMVNLEKIELSQPFAERVIYPIARSLGELAIRFTPQNALQNISKRLEMAGTSSRLDPTLFLAFQFIGLYFLVES